MKKKHELFLFLTIFALHLSTKANEKSWYEFSADGKVCHIYKRDLSTPWFNRLTNGYLTAWVTQKGGIDVFMSDPEINSLVNPQDVSGNFYIKKEGSDKITWINNPEQEDSWECQVGLGYTKIVCVKDEVKTEVTYFIPLDDNVMLMRMHIVNLSSSIQKLNLFGQIEWNLGDRTKYILYRGDGRAGSQHNLYKKAWFAQNSIWATQANWLNTGACRPWPFIGFFSVNIPVKSFETIRSKFLGSNQSFFAKPQEVLEGKLSNTNFWSEDDYPWGVLQTEIILKPEETREFSYILGMDRAAEYAAKTIQKYSDQAVVNEEFNRLNRSFEDLIRNTVNIITPDIVNDHIINIWSKYHWKQVIKKSQNDNSVGVGLWCYGIEGGSINVYPEHIMLPFDENLLKQEIYYLLKNQTDDLSKTDIFINKPAMLYEDIQADSESFQPRKHFDVPHHHNVYSYLTSVLFYLKEFGDTSFLNKEVPFIEGSSGSVWEHIDRALSISLSGLSVNGLPRIPANVGDWMDEFTKISQYGQAESVMLGMELCYYLKEYANIARLAGKTELQKKWEEYYEFIKSGINKTSWDGAWYIRAFSDRNGKHTVIGSSKNKEGKIYLNSQSWSILSGVATPERADKCMNSIKSMLISDFGPMIFFPSYSSYNEYIGTQSIYAPGFRNGCIYIRPAGWAIIAACMAGKNELAWDMYNKASLANQIKRIEIYQCEPYVYPENYVGPDHRLAGKGQFQWCLGEATSWMWVAYNYYLLGIRPEFQGLVIDPRIPKSWEEFSVERPFRGERYSIHVKRNHKLKEGVIKVWLDGKLLRENIIIPVKDGKTHKVEVELG